MHSLEVILEDDYIKSKKTPKQVIFQNFITDTSNLVDEYFYKRFKSEDTVDHIRGKIRHLILMKSFVKVQANELQHFTYIDCWIERLILRHETFKSGISSPAISNDLPQPSGINPFLVTFIILLITIVIVVYLFSNFSGIYLYKTDGMSGRIIPTNLIARFRS